MHQSNVLIIGPNSFTSTLDELKQFLKFNPYFEISDITYNAIIFHIDALKDDKNTNYLNKFNSIKIFASNKKIISGDFDVFLQLPSSLKEINSTVENALAKKVFNKNSSIKIKKYLLDKNEKKLIKKDNFVVLTEKEIQLLELFLNRK